jgi:hypothetical protein
MRYYRILALLALILACLSPYGCGGGKGFIPQLSAQHTQSGAPLLSANQHIPWSTGGRSASKTGLREEQHFTYDYSTYRSPLRHYRALWLSC